MDWDLPRCPAVDPEHGRRCEQTPEHGNAHAAIWTRPRGPVLLRRWRDGKPAVDNGVDRFGDFAPAGEMSWAMGCPGATMVDG